MSTLLSKSLSSLVALAAFSIASAATYDLDMSHSSVGFTVKHMGISNVKGEFKEFTGSYTLDDKTGALTKLTGEVVINSVDTGVEKRDNHLRSPDFFDIAKYPKMTFVMTKNGMKNKTGRITGNLTIHGITRPVVLVGSVAGPAVDPWGNTKSAITLAGTIKREDFGLMWNKTLEAGGFLVGNDVKIDIELEGNAQ